MLKGKILVRSVQVKFEAYFTPGSNLTFISRILSIWLSRNYRVSHLTWKPPRQHDAAAASELPGNELVTTQNTVVACVRLPVQGQVIADLHTSITSCYQVCNYWFIFFSNFNIKVSEHAKSHMTHLYSGSRLPGSNLVRCISYRYWYVLVTFLISSGQIPELLLNTRLLALLIFPFSFLSHTLNLHVVLKVYGLAQLTPSPLQAGLPILWEQFRKG
jgi:hypothetical protein